MPFSGNIHQYRTEKTKQAQKLKKLSTDELSDFRVPITTFKENVKCLRKTKPFVKDRILMAVGIDLFARN